MRDSAGAVRRVRQAVLLGTPLILVLLELFHARDLEPTVYQALSLGADRWLVVHTAQLALFGLMGLALYLLVEGFSGPAATICRISAGVFVLFYATFDVLAGIAPGILVKSGNEAEEGQLLGLEAAAQTLFESAEFGSFAFLKIIGEIGWFVAILSATIALSRPSRPLPALCLLAIAAFLLPVFQFSYDDLPGILGILVVIGLVALMGSTGRAPLPPLIFLALSAVLLTFGHPAPIGSLAFGCFFLGAYFAELSPRTRPDGPTGSGVTGRSGRTGRRRDTVY